MKKLIVLFVVLCQSAWSLAGWQETWAAWPHTNSFMGIHQPFFVTGEGTSIKSAANDVLLPFFTTWMYQNQSAVQECVTAMADAGTEHFLANYAVEIYYRHDKTFLPAGLANNYTRKCRPYLFVAFDMKKSEWETYKSTQTPPLPKWNTACDYAGVYRWSDFEYFEDKMYVPGCTAAGLFKGENRDLFLNCVAASKKNDVAKVKMVYQELNVLSVIPNPSTEVVEYTAKLDGIVKYYYIQAARLRKLEVTPDEL
jgi:hypothetical protein